MSDHTNPDNPDAHLTDEGVLQRALDLARRGVGMASPNPYVGAVITETHGAVVGEGTYTYAGVKHAEVLALEAAGTKARGGTLYINLEPHAHQGRTPPCTDALISAGVHRVVASMPDPNPKVSGRGFEQLRNAGIQVEVGLLQEPAQRINEAFARYIRHNVPLVTLKSAMTLDGKIAPLASVAKNIDANDEFTGSWITGEAARAHVHELRHQQDAILAGVGTVIADNPLLTDRSGLPRRRPLMRVVLDSQLRLPLDSRIVQDAATKKTGDLLVFCSSMDERKKSQLEQLGVRVEQLPSNEAASRPDFQSVLRRLTGLEITSLIIEGGSTINGAALAAGIVDKIFFYYAPKLLGEDSIPFAAGRNSGGTTPITQIKHVGLHRLDQDVAIEGYLRDPYRE
jgi:diaminohydroxyphosphoribosylaminopyrimidine deaminase / 5-amino-6-(5-phosphoribosylamino)uracil reductase